MYIRIRKWIRTCFDIGTKSLSKNPGRTQSSDGELKMQEAQIIRGFLFPPNQKASGTVGPRVCPLHDPTTRPAAPTSRNRRAFTPPGNVSDVLATMCDGSHRIRIVSLVGAEMLLVPSGRLGTPHGNVLKRFGDQLLVMHIGTGDRDADWHASSVGQHRPLDAELATIGRVFPGFFPPPAAPWLSPRPNFATASRSLSTRRTLPEHGATVFRIRQVEPIPGSTHGWRCLTRIALASPSTDNPSAVHTGFPSRHFAKGAVVAPLCNFFCKLGAAV
jgi:hypothetical protein